VEKGLRIIKRWMPKGIMTLVILLVAFVFSLKCSINIWNVGVSGTDSSVFQYVARVILDGGMPYRDTFDHKGPLLYLINTAGLLISRWRGIWLVEWAALFASFAMLYKIARIKCRRITSLIVMFCSVVPLFAYFEGGNLSEEYAMPFIAAATYIFTDYFVNDRINRFRLIICGLSFGAVCLLRINMIVVWAVMCIAVLIQCLTRQQYKRLSFFLTYFILGTLLIAIPIIIWLMVNGAFSAFIQDYFIFNFAYAADSERATLTKWTETFLYFLNNRFVLMALIISIYLAAKKKDIFHCANIVFLFGSIIVCAMSRRIYPHYAMILVPVLAYPFACAAFMLQEEMQKEKGAALLVTAFLLVSDVLPVWIPAFQDVVWMSARPRETYLTSKEAMAREIINQYSQEEDDIIVFGNWNAIYNLSGRFAASRYSFQDPIGKIAPEIMDAFFQELEENKPKVFVLYNNSFDRERGLAFVQSHSYRWVWQSDNGDVDIYVLDETPDGHMIGEVNQ